MAAAKAARRNTTVHMHGYYLPNDPFQDPYIGRRTGVPLNIRARKDSNGFDNIDDYFPDSEPEEENIVPNEQSSDRDLLVGRRTGIPLNINPRKDSKGFESVDDYFPDSVHDDQVEDLPEGASQTPDEQEAPDTPAEGVESPNETGTIIKNPASREPTPQINGPINKRLSFAHGKSPSEPEPSKPVQPRILQDGTKLIAEKEDESDSEINVVDIDDDSGADRQESCDVQLSNAFSVKEKGEIKKTTNTKEKKTQRTMSIEDDEFIDVDGVDNEETFLTIGNTTWNANKSIAVVKSPIPAEAESFAMSESFVLEGTKHKTMSPEYGSCSDSQPEPSDLPAPREKKSKIPVRIKGVPNGTKQKASRARKKKMEDLKQGAESVETENSRDERVLDSKQEETTGEVMRGRTQITKQRNTRGRQKKVEVDEMQKKAAEVTGDLDNKSLSGEIEGDVEVEEESKFVRKKTQSTNRRSTRGRQKTVEDSQDVEPEADEAQNLENDYVEDDVEVGEDLSDSNKDQNDLPKGQEQRIGEEELVDFEAVEARVSNAEKKGKSRARSLPVTTKQQPQKSTRKVKKRGVVASDEELLHGGKKDDIENGQAEQRGRGRKGVPNTRRQEMKVSRGRRQKSEGNLESEVGGDSEDGNGVGERPAGKTRGRQKEKKVDKGRKQGSEEDLECEVGVGDNEVVDPDKGKVVSPLARKRKVAETKKMQRQGKSVAEGGTADEDGAAKLSGRKTRAQRKKEAEQKKEDGDGGERQGGVEDGSAHVELSGRKTRGQSKKVADAKLNKEDGDGGEREEGIQEAIVNSDIEDAGHVEGEDMSLGETGKGEQDSNHSVVVESVKAQELGTVLQRKGRAEKTKNNNELESDGKFGEVVNKRGRESLRDQKTGQSEGQGLIEEGEVSLNARKGKKGKGKEATKISPNGGEKDVLDIVVELDEEQTLSNETLQESVSNSSSVSSVVSSGSESKKKAGTKRRKHSSVLPPYARRASKSKNLKISATGNSQDSTTELELRTDAKKPRLEEGRKKSNISDTTSKKGGVLASGKGSKAVRSVRKSAGGKKPVAQRNKSKKPDVTHEKSVSSAAQNDDDGDFGDSDEMNGEGDGDFSVQEAGGVEDRSFEEVPSEAITPKPFLKPAAKSAAALKSILKSGGSVGRTNTASRKRQMNADKSHSGGSDADDESVLPAKQPNRKRLSTVSFASSPFVHASPADLTSSVASRHSPLPGLSFVTNASSDQSFTPGSGRSVGSSVVSASGVSRAGDSDIDPEEEVTLTNDDGQQEGSTDEQSTRRSKRTIVPPLQFWKNERIDYERRQSGGWAIKGVLKNPTPTPKIRKKSKPKRPVPRKQNHAVDAVDSSEEELGNEDLEGFQEITNPRGTVFNPETKEEVEMDLFHAPGMLNFTNPAGKPATDDDPLLVHKFISQPLFGGGQVILRPDAEKGRQFVRNDTMVFNVIKGKIMVTVHQSSVVLNTGSTFFVPQGNSYNIKNLKQTDAKLMFVQIKG